MRNNQQSRLYNEKRDAIAAYGRKLTKVPIASTDGTFRMPVVREGTQGIILCGLPINCCNRERANGYIVIAGKRIGLCAFATRVFRALHGMEGLGEHTDRIRVINNSADALVKSIRFSDEPRFGTPQRPGLKRLAQIDARRKHMPDDAEFLDDIARNPHN